MDSRYQVTLTLEPSYIKEEARTFEASMISVTGLTTWKLLLFKNHL